MKRWNYIHDTNKNFFNRKQNKTGEVKGWKPFASESIHIFYQFMLILLRCKAVVIDSEYICICILLCWCYTSIMLVLEDVNGHFD
jgi:hypothetical protein